jgi:hypothetical protein
MRERRSLTALALWRALLVCAAESVVEAVQLLQLVLDEINDLEELVQVDTGGGGGHLDNVMVGGYLLASEAGEGVGREKVVHLLPSSLVQRERKSRNQSPQRERIRISQTHFIILEQ